ncbi:putative conserved glutamic acid-rich protein [Phaeomoniella chlamydospora]|uniref:Putative conserved glutamic acid-rich protein n=1 Tax=Phaeomoniella chlamydospora TaxID=158046 RepID=A0A0G2DXP6_PHACM|nr:putative conserved glutamic acid-rich protein [Phaeomoniella chlamydospora]
MDVSNQDEHMDFGSDLPLLDNDIDIDGASMRDASRGPSVEQDIMIEDIDETANALKVPADDEMIDEEYMEDDVHIPEEDMAGDDHNSATMYDEDDLIYEDEDVVVNDEEQVDVDFKDEDGPIMNQEGDTEGAHIEILEDEIPTELNDTQASNYVEASPVHEQPERSEQSDTATVEESLVSNETTTALVGTLNTGTEGQRAETEGLGHVDTSGIIQKTTDSEAPDAGNDVDGAQQQHTTESFNATSDDGHHDAGHAKSPQPTPTDDHPATTEDSNDNEEAYGDNATETSYEGHTLHPVKVQYDGTEICLFPPVEGTGTFFVQDAGLAFSPCDELLSACREVLGNSIEETHELVLDFPSLGLHLSEGSSYSKQLTIAQILDVYLALCQNDHHESPGPVYCTLRTRVSLASQYAFLVSAVNNGKGLSGVENHLRASTKGSGIYIGPHTPQEPITKAHETEAPKVADSKQSDDSPDEQSALHDRVNDEYPIQEETSTSNEDVPAQPKPKGVATSTHKDGDNKYEGLEDDSDISSSFDETLDEQGDALSADPAFHADTANENSHSNFSHGDDGLDPPKERTAQPSILTDEESGLIYDAGQAFSSDDGEAETAVKDFAFDPDGSVAGGAETIPADAIDHAKENQTVDNTDIDDELLGTEDFLAAGDVDGQETLNEVVDVGQGEVKKHTKRAAQEHNGIANEVPRSEREQDFNEAAEVPEGSSNISNDSGVSSGSPALDDEEDILTLDDEAVTAVQTSKRKATDEDDFGLMDPTTPEKKKHRPS